MNHLTEVLCRRNLRAYISAFITYLMLAGQAAPIALAARPRAAAPPRTEARVPAAPAARPAPAPLFAAPNITATKVDSWDDSATPDGKAEPGQTITYTVTITNTGDADATGVTFNDSVDTNTTLVPGSTTTQPVAAPDSYNVIGNVRIQIPDGANNLLANDCDPDPNGGPCTNAGLTASGPTTTAQGGNITINADGSFSYNPAPGFTGTDTVTYTVTDATSRPTRPSPPSGSATAPPRPARTSSGSSTPRPPRAATADSRTLSTATRAGRPPASRRRPRTKLATSSSSSPARTRAAIRSSPARSSSGRARPTRSRTSAG